MLSDKRNWIMAKAMGLIFSVFDIASAREVPFGILQYVQCILLVYVWITEVLFKQFLICNAV